MMRPQRVYRIWPQVAVDYQSLVSMGGVPGWLLDFLGTLIGSKGEGECKSLTRQQLLITMKKNNLSATSANLSRVNKLLNDTESSTEYDEYSRGQKFQISEIQNLRNVIQFYQIHGQKKHPTTNSHKPKIHAMNASIERISALGQNTHLNMSISYPPRIESLFSILDSSMRLSGHDQRTSIKCTYKFFDNDYISISTSTLTDQENGISCLSDERAMRAINGGILDKLEQEYGNLDNARLKEEEVINRQFFFDIYNLCRKIGLTASRNNREIVRKMIERLRDTTFTIDATKSEYFRNNYTNGADIKQYRYITEFSAKKAEDLEAGSLKERYYGIKLHSAIMANLISVGRNFISHDALISERSGLAHRINNWSKAVIGVRSKVNANKHRYTLREFRDKLMPAARMDNFHRDLIKLFKRQCNSLIDENGCRKIDSFGKPLYPEATAGWQEDSTNIAWLYGYYYRLSFDEHEIAEHCRMRRIRNYNKKNTPLITVWRDINDEYVGDNSLHNQALQRIQNEMIDVTQ